MQDEYVLGEFVNLAEQVGSRRIGQKPHPVKIPTPGSHGPSKRRRAAALKIPSSAPFHHPCFENAILDASAEELRERRYAPDNEPSVREARLGRTAN